MPNPDVGELKLSTLSKEQIIELIGDAVPIRKKKDAQKCALYLSTKQGPFFCNTKQGQEFLLDNGKIFGAKDEPIVVENQPAPIQEPEPSKSVESADSDGELPPSDEPQEKPKKSFWDKPLFGDDDE